MEEQTKTGQDIHLRQAEEERPGSPAAQPVSNGGADVQPVSKTTIFHFLDPIVLRRLMVNVAFGGTLLAATAPFLFILASSHQANTSMWFSWCVQLYWVWIGSHVAGLGLPVLNTLDGAWWLYVLGNSIWIFDILVLNKSLSIRERACWLLTAPLQALVCIPIFAYAYFKRELSRLDKVSGYTRKGYQLTFWEALIIGSALIGFLKRLPSGADLCWWLGPVLLVVLFTIAYRGAERRMVKGIRKSMKALLLNRSNEQLEMKADNGDNLSADSGRIVF